MLLLCVWLCWRRLWQSALLTHVAPQLQLSAEEVVQCQATSTSATKQRNPTAEPQTQPQPSLTTHLHHPPPLPHPLRFIGHCLTPPDGVRACSVLCVHSVTAELDGELDVLERCLLYLSLLSSEAMDEALTARRLLRSALAVASSDAAVSTAYRPFIHRALAVCDWHVEVLTLFGRLPHLNAARGRMDTEAEREWKRRRHPSAAGAAAATASTATAAPHTAAAAARGRRQPPAPDRRSAAIDIGDGAATAGQGNGMREGSRQPQPSTLRWLTPAADAQAGVAQRCTAPAPASALAPAPTHAPAPAAVPAS